MRGLLIKDFFCLKRQFYTFLTEMAGSFIVSVLFGLSSRYGNLALEFQSMLSDGDMTEDGVMLLIRYVLFFFLLIPMAFTGNVADVFLDDKNASFQKLASAMPISIAKRVAARYMTGLSFTLLGFVMATMIALALSSLTELVSFGELFGVLVSFASFMVIYLAIFIVFEYLLGVDKTAICQILPIIIIGLVLIIPHIGEVSKMFLEGDVTSFVLRKFQGIQDFLTNQSYLAAITAIALLAGSYGISVGIAKRKRGVA